METALTIRDESTSGDRKNVFTLNCLTERMTIRELIRARIYQEVRDFNQNSSERFYGLVQPTDAERDLNGYRFTGPKKKIDWEVQFQRALEAFERNGFFVLVDNRQAENLDETFEVKVDTEVSFIKLVPLVGG